MCLISLVSQPIPPRILLDRRREVFRGGYGRDTKARGKGVGGMDRSYVWAGWIGLMMDRSYLLDRSYDG